MPLVIVDGPEAAGKSIIIDRLREEWGSNTGFRAWGPKKSWLEYCQPLFDDLQECEKDPQRLIVWSRSWLSRIVYNRLLSQGQSIPNEVTTELDNIVVRSGGLLIFISSPAYVLMKRRLERVHRGDTKPDHPLDPGEELAAFQRAVRNQRWKTFLGTDPPEDNVRTIITMLVHRNLECRMDPRKEEPIGSRLGPLIPAEIG